MSDLTNVLVPVSALREHADAIRALTDAANTGGDAPAALQDALRYYTLFGDKASVERVGLGVMSPERLFYNRYFWFKRFAHHHGAAHGYDAGIEQQAFQLLEQAPTDVDWAIVEQIENEAGSGSAA